jgi:hypothetical protein
MAPWKPEIPAVDVDRLPNSIVCLGLGRSIEDNSPAFATKRCRHGCVHEATAIAKCHPLQGVPTLSSNGKGRAESANDHLKHWRDLQPNSVHHWL